MLLNKNEIIRPINESIGAWDLFHPFVRPPVLWVPPLAGGFFLKFLSYCDSKSFGKIAVFLRK